MKTNLVMAVGVIALHIASSANALASNPCVELFTGDQKLQDLAVVPNQPANWSDSWQLIQKYLSGLSSDRPTQLAAIHSLANLRISYTGFVTNEDYAKPLTVVQELSKVVQTSRDNTVKLEALQAIFKFASANSDNFRRGGYLGRSTPYEIGLIESNYDLPDDIRRVANWQLNESFRLIGVWQQIPFVPSAQLRTADTIDFLGKTNRELNPPQRSAAYKVQQYFSGESSDVKRALYSELASGGDLPQAYFEKFLRAARIQFANDISILAIVGFTQIRYLDGDVKEFTNPKTGTKITVHDSPTGESNLRLNSADVAGIWRAVLAGIDFTVKH